MINIIAGACTAVFLLISLYIAPKVVSLFGLPPATSDIFKILIGAVPWVFTTIRGWLLERKARHQDTGHPIVISKLNYRWSLYTAGKAFLFYQFISTMATISALAVAGMANSQVPDFSVDAVKVINFFIVVPILFIYLMRYGIDLYEKNIRNIPATLIFFCTSLVLSAIEAAYLSTDGPTITLKLEKWQIVAHVFFMPLLQTLALVAGLSFIAAISALQTKNKAAASLGDQPAAESLNRSMVT